MMTDEYKQRLIALAKEVSETFGYNTINTRSMRLEVDMAQIGKLWSLIAFIMALENEGKIKNNGQTQQPKEEAPKEEPAQPAPAEETNQTE